MSWFKRLIDWVVTAYADEEPKFRPKRVFIIKGKEVLFKKEKERYYEKMSSVFNRSEVDFTKQPMFFGEDQNTQRYDQFKYPIFDKLTQQQLGYFWRPEEVSLQKDRNDFLSLRDEQKHIFTSNLRYQTLLDSVQGRGPAIAFVPFCSLPELEGCMIAWDFIETIHSRSYTYIIKNVYPNPADVFDHILKDKHIIQRAEVRN